MAELLEILDNHKVNYKKTNNPSEILIKCTGGNHNDENPSLSYNLDNNIFHCWSCGFSGGKNKFLKICFLKLIYFKPSIFLKNKIFIKFGKKFLKAKFLQYKYLNRDKPLFL